MAALARTSAAALVAVGRTDIVCGMCCECGRYVSGWSWLVGVVSDANEEEEKKTWAMDTLLYFSSSTMAFCSFLLLLAVPHECKGEWIYLAWERVCRQLASANQDGMAANG